MTHRTAKGQRAMHRAASEMTLRSDEESPVRFTSQRTLEDGWTPDDVTDESIAKRVTTRTELVMLLAQGLEQRK